MTKTDIKAICPECNKEVNARGLKGHRRLSHGIINSHEKHREGEVKRMAEQGYCPGCDEKKDTIRDLKAAAEKAEAAHAQTLLEKTRETEGVAAQITSLKAQVEAAKTQEPAAPQFPSVDDFVEHCKTCDYHKPQLRQFMDKVMSAMSPDEVKAQMKRLKIDEAPNKITIGIGDREMRR